jgi:redox-sensitive bicupin YhaK (pirin superfamily)
MTNIRSVLRKVPGMPAEDGAGVKLTRLVGQPRLPDLDPILMLDQIRSDDPDAYIAGFPPHPHRGFETVTYLISGRMRHQDNKGHEGVLEEGGVQWMTAGHGIVHSEMPEQQDGLLFGFQLWLNLPSGQKLRDAWYRDIPFAELGKVAQEGGVSAIVIAGQWGEVAGPGPERDTQPFIIDVAVPAGAQATVPVPSGHAGFAFVFDGAVAIGETAVTRGELAILAGDGALVIDGGAQGGRLLVVAGKPIKEPIAKYGPFVMNTEAELIQAVRDYQAGVF